MHTVDLLEVNTLPSNAILEQKKQQVAELSEMLKGSVSGVIVDYSGITVADDTKLRKELREAGCTYKVVKNTLLSRALKDAGIDGLDNVLEGTTAIAVSADDYVAPARILCGFADKNAKFNVKAGYADGDVLSAEKVNDLAKLPSKEVLLAPVLYGLNGNLTKLAIAINAIVEKMNEGAAPAEEAQAE